MDLDNDGVGLNVAIDGTEGAPPIVLLHGITASSRTWAWLLPLLTEQWRTYRLDFRGHGSSARAPGRYDGADYLADAATLCRWIGEPVVVIGHSLGGVTGAALAQHHPELVRGAVLEDPPLPSQPAGDAHALLDAFRLMRDMIPQLQASGIAVDTLAEMLGAAPTSTGPTFAELLRPDALTTMAADWLDVDAAVLDPVLDGSMSFALDPDGFVEAPVRLIIADPSKPDGACRPADATHFAARGHQVDVVVADGAGHLIHDSLGHRDWFGDQVTEFLGSLTRV